MVNLKEEVILKENLRKLYSGEIKEFHPSDIYLEEIHFSPAKIIDTLEEWGFSCEYSDANGWEQDTEYFLEREELSLVMNYSGYYFTITISVKGEDFE